MERNKVMKRELLINELKEKIQNKKKNKLPTLNGKAGRRNDSFNDNQSSMRGDSRYETLNSNEIRESDSASDIMNMIKVNFRMK